MEIRSKITPEVIQAATAILSPYIPDISPTGLLDAIRNYKSAATRTIPKKLYTRKEVAEILGTTLATINSMLNRGTLRRIHVGVRSVRIDPESVSRLINGGATVEA